MNNDTVVLAAELDIRTCELMATIEMLADMDNENSALIDALALSQSKIIMRDRMIAQLKRQVSELQIKLMRPSPTLLDIPAALNISA